MPYGAKEFETGGGKPSPVLFFGVDKVLPNYYDSHPNKLC
jgi:hypothetical protein